MFLTSKLYILIDESIKGDKANNEWVVEGDYEYKNNVNCKFVESLVIIMESKN